MSVRGGVREDCEFETGYRKGVFDLFQKGWRRAHRPARDSFLQKAWDWKEHRQRQRRWGYPGRW